MLQFRFLAVGTPCQCVIPDRVGPTLWKATTKQATCESLGGSTRNTLIQRLVLTVPVS